MNTVQKVRILQSLKLFNLVRSYYYKFELARRPKVLNFYRQFIQEGDLCFDVGANIGRKIDIFLKVGGRIVAFEPHPECQKFLRDTYKSNKHVTIIGKALDSIEGEKSLYLCEINSLSTMSQDWVKSTKSFGLNKEFNWNKEIRIKSGTLDSFIKEFGRPKFCKIDVEGFELNVLKGLSQPIPIISFELASFNLEMMKSCIRYLHELNKTKVSFNLTSGELAEDFIFPKWSSCENFIKQIDLIPSKSRFGEIYAQSY